MLTTQAAALPPRIHALYTDLPAPTRRAANMPFLAAPARARTARKPSRVISFAPPAPVPTRRAPPPPPQHQHHRMYPRLHNDEEDPFADASAVPLYVPVPPALPSSTPRRTDVLAPRRADAHIHAPRRTGMGAEVDVRVQPATVTVTVAPAVRDMRARAVACMLLSRGGTGGRPMRRRTPLPRQYVRSGLSACVAVASADEV